MSDLDSDEITAITDTVEGEQVAGVIRDVYWQLVTNQTIPEHKSLFQLTDAEPDELVFMLIPTTVRNVEWIKYNKIEADGTDAVWATIPYLPPNEFIELLTTRTTSDTNVVTATDPTSTIDLEMIADDVGPSWWSSFDDEYVVFDSYDATVDTTGLLAEKTLCWGSIEPVFTVANSVTGSFVPDLDDHLFPLLLAEAKSTCFMNIKQTANAKVEKQARTQRVSAQNDKYRAKAAEKDSTGSTGPDYGRRRR